MSSPETPGGISEPLDHDRDPVQGPHPGGEAVSLGSFEQFFSDHLDLGVVETRPATRPTCTFERFTSAFGPLPKPAGRSLLGHLQLDRDIDLPPPRSEHLRRPHPPLTQRPQITAGTALLDFPGVGFLAGTGLLPCHSSMIKQHGANHVQRHALLPKHL
nr:hypothetical protein [Rhodococcus sp. LW-XY12]